MKISKFVVFLSLSCIFLSVSLFAEKQPDWVSGKSKAYPSQNYLTGVGIGRDLDWARSNARAEISKIFKLRVTQVGQDTLSEETIKGKTDYGALGQIKTQVSTDQILQGVEIKEIWLDSKKKTHYALAVLDKQKTRLNLSQQISDSEEIIQLQLSVAKNSPSAIETARALNKALIEWGIKDELSARKRIVDPVSVPELNTGASRAQTAKQKEEALNKILFTVTEDEKNQDANLKTIVSERITKLGFKIVPAVPDKIEQGSSVIAIKCGVTAQPFERNNPNWRFYSWQGTAVLEDAAQGAKVVATISKQGQSSHINEKAANDKALSEASQSVALAVEQQINQYIFGE